MRIHEPSSILNRMLKQCIIVQQNNFNSLDLRAIQQHMIYSFNRMIPHGPLRQESYDLTLYRWMYTDVGHWKMKRWHTCPE
jgi:hypothetical protein